jgi:lysophospholipid acyltransferase (LPLAT)-like uncharacterized protein
MSAATRPAEVRASLSRGQRIGVAIAPPLVRALYGSWRVHSIGEEPWRALRAKREPFIFALWHGQLLPLLAHHHDQGVRVLISEHRDGEIIARIAHALGFVTVRGSTTRGGARALLAMCDALGRGEEIAVTPDGPRGPARVFAPGALVAAQRAGVPIVPAAIAASRAWRLRSWDGFTIPKPFAQVTVAYGAPMRVEATSARDAAEEAPRFAAALDATVAAAERAAGHVSR